MPAQVISTHRHKSHASAFFWGDPEGGRLWSRFLGDMALMGREANQVSEQSNASKIIDLNRCAANSVRVE